MMTTLPGLISLSWLDGYTVICALCCRSLIFSAFSGVTGGPSAASRNEYDTVLRKAGSASICVTSAPAFPPPTTRIRLSLNSSGSIRL